MYSPHGEYKEKMPLLARKPCLSPVTKIGDDKIAALWLRNDSIIPLLHHCYQ